MKKLFLVGLACLIVVASYSVGHKLGFNKGYACSHLAFNLALIQAGAEKEFAIYLGYLAIGNKQTAIDNF